MYEYNEDWFGANDFTDAQQKALAVVPKFTSFLSLLAQLWIIAEVSHSQQKRGSVYHRLLAALSLAGLFRATGLFLSTWPMPAEQPFVFGNVGSLASCNCQGFLIQFGLSAPLYVAMICVYYWLAIRHGWSERRIQRIERYMHIVPWVCGIATAVTGLVLDLYNPGGFYCWIAPFPDGCDRDSDIPCERGEHSNAYKLALYYAPLLVSFAVVLYCLGSVYFGMRREEMRTLKYRQPHLFKACAKNKNSPCESSKDNSTTTNSGRSIRRSITQCYDTLYCRFWSNSPNYRSEKSSTQVLASQVLWYVLAFIAAHYSGTLRGLLLIFKPGYFQIVLLQAFFEPLQGLFDFLVYRRPIYLRLRKDTPALRRSTVLVQTIQWPGIEAQIGKCQCRSSLASNKTSKEEEPEQYATHNTNIPLDDDDDDHDHENGDQSKNSIRLSIIGSKKQVSLRKVDEDNAMSDDDDNIFLSEDGDSNVGSEEDPGEWLDFCMERDRQFGLLSIIYIIEEVKWVSVEVKRQLALQRSLPIIKMDGDNDDEFCPPPRALAFHVTI
jgi:hypothetical protein